MFSEKYSNTDEPKPPEILPSSIVYIKEYLLSLIFETKNNGKFFAKANRIDSKIEAGAGYFDVLFGSSSLEVKREKM